MKSNQFLSVILLLCIPFLGFAQARSFRDFIVAASSPTNPKASETNFKTAGGTDLSCSVNGAKVGHFLVAVNWSKKVTPLTSILKEMNSTCARTMKT